MDNIVFRVGDIITCALNEGAIMVAMYDASSSIIELSAELKGGDVVKIDYNPVNTYYSCDKFPVVLKPVPRDPSIVGWVVSPPRWIQMPFDPERDWEECLKHKWYRYAYVRLSENIWVKDGRWVDR